MQQNQPEATRQKWALVIHGGAGTIRKTDMKPGEEDAILTTLDSALTIGRDLLEQGRPALEVVEVVVSFLEDCPHFNAGRGAVFTHEGKNELDASIMDGSNLKAGAVAGVTTVRNPIRLARVVMEKSPHVFLSGKGAEQYAAENGLELVEQPYFFNQQRWDNLQKVLRNEADSGFVPATDEHPDSKFGTVGCVVLDTQGNLAAATSTGGMTNKRWGRIGDSPVIGAGTYSDNRTCAVSCTGHGEFFIRHAVAHDIHARMLYGGSGLKEAAETLVHDVIKKAGGTGGLIAVDKLGNISLPFNTEGMYRAWALPDGSHDVAIYAK